MKYTRDVRENITTNFVFRCTRLHFKRVFTHIIPKRESENTSARIKVRHAIIPRKGFRVYVSTQKVPGGKAISQRYIALPRHRHKVHEEREARFRVNVKRNRSGEQPLRSVSLQRDEFLSF